jgi:hypothetical protein
MHTRLSAVALVASFVASAGAFAACPPGQTRNCVNFDLVPEISKQIVAQESAPTGSKFSPRTEPAKPYTGPTVGIAPGVRRAPTVGYRWSLE